MKVDLTNRISDAVTVLYGLAGLWFLFETSLRVWQEGWLGNKTEILFIFMYGPFLLAVYFISALMLVVGQIMKLFRLQKGIWLSRISLLFMILALVDSYLIEKSGYIWGYTIDFGLFFCVVVIIYLPVVLKSRPSFLPGRVTPNT